uniref:Uncharacterized protein n=1 Tax=Anguilla anguilla TaxID=7936 RepID=A0A0E9TTB2_ANGAN
MLCHTDAQNCEIFGNMSFMVLNKGDFQNPFLFFTETCKIANFIVRDVI